MNVRIFPDARSAAEACAVEMLAARTLAVSGGTTPKLMFDAMAKAGADWSDRHLFFVDERAVPPDDEQSNYRLARLHLIEPGGLPPSSVHRVFAELDPQAAAARYDAEIRQFFGGSEPELDIVQLGMGPDAHTASLFPGEPKIGDREGLVAALYVECKQQWRITFLPRVILSARRRVFLATGADKAAALRDVLEGPLDPMRFPAQLAAQDADWFVDEAAVAQLSRR